MTWNWLIGGCWFSHEQITDRDDQGRLILRCLDCGAVQRPQLDAEIVLGPAHVQEPVRGTPKVKAVPEVWFKRRKVG